MEICQCGTGAQFIAPSFTQILPGLLCRIRSWLGLSMNGRDPRYAVGFGEASESRPYRNKPLNREPWSPPAPPKAGKPDNLRFMKENLPGRPFHAEDPGYDLDLARRHWKPISLRRRFRSGDTRVRLSRCQRTQFASRGRLPARTTLEWPYCFLNAFSS